MSKVLVNFDHPIADFELNYEYHRSKIKRGYDFIYENKYSIEYSISLFQVTITYVDKLHPDRWVSWGDNYYKTFVVKYKVVDGKIVIQENKIKDLELYNEKQFVIHDFVLSNPVITNAMLEINEIARKRLGV
jgi:hypothetical protein